MGRRVLGMLLVVGLLSGCVDGRPSAEESAEAHATTTGDTAPPTVAPLPPTSVPPPPVTAASPATTSPTTTTTATPPEPATLVFWGGPVLTIEAGRVAEAIAVRGDLIVAVGEAEEILRFVGPETTVVDLDGAALMPGIVDPHGHWISDRHLAGIDDPVAAALNAARHGVTTMYDLFVKAEDLAELIALDEAGGLPVRVTVYFPVNYLTRFYGIWFSQYTPGEMLSPHVRVGGAKLFVDPTDPDRMLLSNAHADDQDFYGEAAISGVDLTDLVTRLDDAGRQVVIHTGGDAAHDMVLDAFAAALDGGPNDLRHRIEHVAVVRDDQIDRMAELGILASIQTSWFSSDWIGHPQWGSFEAELGQARINWAGRWNDLLEGGVTVIGGTDAPWTPPVSIGGWAEAVTRVGASGRDPAGWMLDQRIPIEEALRITTASAAYGGFEEEIKGTLAAGKLADLIVLSADPLAIPPDELIDLRVLVTIVGGEAVYCAEEARCP
jgi:predicted amidohydrolase YtcJ